MSRATMTVTDTVTHNTETRTYYDQQYNEFTKAVGNSTQTKRVLWLGGTPYNAPAALVKRYGEQDWTLVHVLRDNLGSITHVVDTTGAVLQEVGYTAWGMLRDPETMNPCGPDNQPELLLGRGYSGHEHLPWFGLVNMNARLYDPAVGRFLSPDPIIQAPDNTQNYNRYSYCLNNPLRYRDENGEFFLGLIVGFFKGLFTGQNVFKTAWKTGVNETKILAGLFAFDKPSNFGDAICKFFSRFVYEGSQTSIGLIVSLGKNLFSDIDNVEYYRGATYLIDFGASHKNGMTIGSYININSPQKDANSSEVYSEGSFNPTNDEMFVHEYGHYLQSQKYGPFYLPAFAIPSLYSAWKNSESKHVNFYTEIDASTRAAAFWGFSYSEWFETYKNDADPLYPGMLEWYLSYYNR